jgi:outer membrane protein assembly factor BamA
MALSLFGLGALAAETEHGSAWDGRVVSEIQVKGIKRIELDAILAKMGTKKGERFKCTPEKHYQ